VSRSALRADAQRPGLQGQVVGPVLTGGSVDAFFSPLRHSSN